MTLIAIFSTLFLTFLLSFPAMLLTGLFLTFIGQPIATMLWGPGIGFIASIAFTSVIPGLLLGGMSGGLGMWLSRKAFADADWGIAAIAVTVVMVIYVIVAPLVNEHIIVWSLLTDVTGAVVALFVLAAATPDMEERWRAWFTLVARGVMVVAVAECFIIPIVTIEPMQPDADLPVFEPITPEEE